jgi:hypothetical protein
MAVVGVVVEALASALLQALPQPGQVVVVVASASKLPISPPL